MSRLVLALALAWSSTAAAEPVQGLAWQFDGAPERTWFIENEVIPPSLIWFLAERNTDIRVVAFQTRLVLDCADYERASRKAHDVTCRISDVALQAAKLPGDKGDLQALLEEVDERLTGANIQLRLRADGRITQVDLEDYETDATNRRTTRMQETLRLILSRAVAGLDLELPRKGVAEASAWPQYQSQLLLAPTAIGTTGSAQIAHKVQDREGPLVAIESMGKAIISPGTGADAENIYDTRLEGVAAFDVEAGHMVQRVWTAVGTPTASSRIAEAGKGISYVQRGFLRMVLDGEDRPSVGETREVAPPGETPTALQQWTPLGMGAPVP